MMFLLKSSIEKATDFVIKVYQAIVHCIRTICNCQEYSCEKGDIGSQLIPQYTLPPVVTEKNHIDLAWSSQILLEWYKQFLEGKPIGQDMSNIGEPFNEKYWVPERNCWESSKGIISSNLNSVEVSITVSIRQRKI
jgi:hypothetical protein